MVKQADQTYDQAREGRAYAGLMSLEQIRAKRARIESGEEYEDTKAKAQRQEKLDVIAAAKEEKVSSPRK